MLEVMIDYSQVLSIPYLTFSFTCLINEARSSDVQTSRFCTVRKHINEEVCKHLAAVTGTPPISSAEAYVQFFRTVGG